MDRFKDNSWVIACIAILVGAVVGLIYYGVFSALGEIFSIAFIFFVPTVMGVVAALLTPKDKPKRAYSNAALAILIVFVVTVAALYEGLVCWVILAPIALVAAFVGVFIVNLFRGRRAGKVQILYTLIFLPVVVFPIENQIPDATIYQTTHNSIVIEASVETVWHAIKSVPTIQESEYHTSWTHRLGFPRPLAATLSHEGVGGVRTAGFTSGLSFLEEVTDWQPNKTLAFSIVVQGEPEERIAFPLGPEIGGRFVDVESGRYTIEVIDDTKVVLHLVSTQRLTSKLNAYAGFWVDAVMGDLQSTILEVIKSRCENGTLAEHETDYEIEYEFEIRKTL